MMFGRHRSLAQEVRFALVIGNDQYRTATLATPANDAGLIADAPGAAGFAVTGARNLDQAPLQGSFSGVYWSSRAGRTQCGRGDLSRRFRFAVWRRELFRADRCRYSTRRRRALQAIRISDFTQPLAALPGRVKIIVLDAARKNPFARGGRPLAGGLALVDPRPGLAIAFNVAPGLHRTSRVPTAPMRPRQGDRRRGDTFKEDGITQRPCVPHSAVKRINQTGPGSAASPAEPLDGTDPAPAAARRRSHQAAAATSSSSPPHPGAPVIDRAEFRPMHRQMRR